MKTLYQAYCKGGKPIGKPKTAKQKEAIDGCVSSILWAVVAA